MHVLTLDFIRLDGGTQTRVGIEQAIVADYAEQMAAGAVFPPVIVFHDGTDHWLADGFHRVEAAKQAGCAEIAADIRDGSKRDAVLFSVSANAAHGLRRAHSGPRGTEAGVPGILRSLRRVELA
ncbi:MAG: ParB-like nuclease domain-containing protein [Chloroflexi bacterium]|nr:ParB-like nuclease domain-containing protein [Chloroflexota bacterium]